MPRTPDDLPIELMKTAGPSGAARPAGRLVSLRRDRSRSPKPAAPALPVANVFPLAKTVRNDSQPAPAAVAPMPLLRIWWMRWRERRRFARALPWMADEVLQDYGLTREEARRLCRRPFWLA